MYSVLVVDDFDLDRKQMVSLVEGFTHLPLCVCGECDNGYEALDLVHNLRPDILLLDVEMPGMNGIELAGQLRAENNAVRIVFCSLYDKAHYLRAAIQIRSDGYLMKPVERGELQACLEEILLRVTDLEKQERRFEQLRRTMLENQAYQLRELFSDVMLGSEAAGSSAGHRLSQLGLGEGRAFRVALVDINSNNAFSDRLDREDIGLIPYRVYRSLVAHSAERVPYYVVRVNERRYILVLCFEGNPAPEATHALAEEVLEGFVRHMRESSISLSATFGDLVSDVRELRGQYQLCCYRLNHRWKYNGDEVIFAAERTESVTDPLPDMQMIQTDLRMLLETENEEIARAAEEYASQLLGSASLPVRKLICHYVLGNICLALQEDGLNPAAIGKEQDADPMSLVLSLERPEDCEKLLVRLIVSAYAAIHQRNPSAGADLMERVRQFIRESDLKTVQLHSVARHFSYSPNYLNHVFKTATGVTILEYITACRVERAKELMQHTDLSLSEIAEEVGYSHATYLSIVFKKQEGITPKQYAGRVRP